MSRSPSPCGRTDLSSLEDLHEAADCHRVVMLGATGVGKTALTNQFMTSDYSNTYDASLGK